MGNHSLTIKVKVINVTQSMQNLIKHANMYRYKMKWKAITSSVIHLIRTLSRSFTVFLLVQIASDCLLNTFLKSGFVQLFCLWWKCSLNLNNKQHFQSNFKKVLKRVKGTKAKKNFVKKKNKMPIKLSFNFSLNVNFSSRVGEISSWKVDYGWYFGYKSEKICLQRW